MKYDPQEQIDILRSNAEGYASMGFGASSHMCENAARCIEELQDELRKSEKSQSGLGAADFARSATVQSPYETRWVQVGWGRIEKRESGFDVVGGVSDERTEYHTEPLYICKVGSVDRSFSTDK